jgi:uncharacterized protein YndB with AHSA1/START domain
VINSTRSSKLIHASVESVYHAFTNPLALQTWLSPGGMTAKIHHFDWREGGGYEMSLYYPDNNMLNKGKTAANEDRYTATIISLLPFKKIVLAIRFKTEDPDFSGEMIMEVSMTKKEGNTDVTFLFRNIPKGITPEDNETGTISTLEKLASYARDRDEIDEQYSDGSANAFDGK